MVRDPKVHQLMRRHKVLKFCRLIHKIGSKRNRPVIEQEPNSVSFLHLHKPRSYFEAGGPKTGPQNHNCYIGPVRGDRKIQPAHAP